MNSNFDYPKNEMEFYCRVFSVDDLVNNYKFNELMAYYMYGLNTIKAIQELIDTKNYYQVDKSYDEIQNDKTWFILKTTIVKNAIKKISICDILVTSNNVFVVNSN